MNRTHLRANQTLYMPTIVGRSWRSPGQSYPVLLAAANKSLAMEVGPVVDEQGTRQADTWPVNVDVPVRQKARLVKDSVQ